MREGASFCAKIKYGLGVYEDQIFTVTEVDTSRRIVYTTIEMFGTMVKLQFNADDVRKV